MSSISTCSALDSSEDLKSSWEFFSQLEGIAGKRVLCVGLGGGCDVIFACAIAQLLQSLTPPPHEVVYANSSGIRSTKGLEQVSESVWRVGGDQPRPLEPGETGYGQTIIEQSLPRGAQGCPLIFFVDKNIEGDTPATLTERNRSKLLPQIEALGFDTIIGVDAGGDSVTGGVDWQESPAFGRDRQMLAVLSSALWASFLHVVVGPGCDGESSESALRGAFHRLQEAGILLGSFDMDERLLSSIRPLAQSLARNRTPNIVEDCASGALVADQDGMVVVPRMEKPRLPIRWLTRGLVLRWESNLDATLPVLEASHHG